ncbi:MAG: protease HtpX, partial [Acidimicrobiia bacterium]
MNNVKTVALLAFMTTLLWLVGSTLFGGGGNGFWIGMAFAVGFNLLAYFFSDKLALAASRARPVTEAELPEVYAIVRRLALQKNMPEPRIYVIDSPQPNA